MSHRILLPICGHHMIVDLCLAHHSRHQNHLASDVHYQHRCLRLQLLLHHPYSRVQMLFRYKHQKALNELPFQQYHLMEPLHSASQ